MWTGCVEGKGAGRKVVPLVLVRGAGAPSKVIKFSGLREPLKFAGPWVKPKLRLARVVPRAPGTKAASQMGLRPFNSRESICSRVTSFCTDRDSVCICTVEAETTTVWLA